MSDTNQIDLLRSDIESVESRSPLWMISSEPALNDLVFYLDAARQRILQSPSTSFELVFSRTHLKTVRSSFDTMIRRGEEVLHRLCQLLCNTFVGKYQLQSVVIGEVPGNHERFMLMQDLSVEDLYSINDLDLGNRQLSKLRYLDGQEWCTPNLVANVVEYQPTEPNSAAIYKVISRIKAEEELWNKVVDEIFKIDTVVTRDKELKHLSRFVKDVFGVKIITGTSADALKLHETLESTAWNEEQLHPINVRLTDETARLAFIETKNYLKEREKSSGWEALKSVVRWHDRTFEIQIQPLKNFWRERELLTRESHAGFKSRREQVRAQVSEQIPLFGFYQTLLKWLVHGPVGEPPTFPGVQVKVVE